VNFAPNRTHFWAAVAPAKRGLVLGEVCHDLILTHYAYKGIFLEFGLFLKLRNKALQPARYAARRRSRCKKTLKNAILFRSPAAGTQRGGLMQAIQT
jgi:hypothetical protein